MLKSRIPQIIVEIDVIVDDVLEAAGERVTQAAKDRAPRRTGALAESIHPDKERDGVYVVAGDKDVWYGHLVEHGTTHTAPQPFLVPALEENRSGIVQMASERLRGL